jgi:ubiquinone biosynthesis protein
MRLPAIFRLEQNTRRFAEVVGVLARYGLADWLGGLRSRWLQRRLVSSRGEALGNLPREARVRLALTELGTTYIKFGQMLSTRPDLVGPALAAELGHLRSNTPPDPPEIVRATILAELGKPVEQLFADFQDRPLASASIGQVHCAHLLSGEAVVVKVQHAGIPQKIAGDLDIMAGLADLAEKHIDAVRAYQPGALVREFRRTLLDELDFSSERRHQEEFIKHFAGDPTVHFPAVYPELCSRKVLTMELLEGLSAENVEGMTAAGANLDEFARRGADMYLKMIFRDGFYHADPHPGNLMLLPGGVVGVLDCGMVGRVDERLKEDLEDLILGVLHGDAEEVSGVVSRLGAIPPDLDREILRAELGIFVAEHSSQSISDLDLSRTLNEMTDIIHRYHITLPPSCSLLLKTLVMLEGTGRQFNPKFSLAELIRPYGASLVRQRFSLKRLAGRLERAYRDWDRLVEVLPRDLAEILQRLRSNSFEVRHRLPRAETAVNRLTVGIVSAGLFVASAELLSHAVAPAPGGVSALGVLGLLVASGLAIRLVWQIGRSDN